MKMSLRTKLLTLLGTAVIGLIGNACIVVTDPYSDYNYNERPYITDAFVTCFWDDYYLDYGWEFIGQVDDPDGYTDVSNVFVDVYDASGFLESWELAPDGGAQWSNLIYETYSTYLNCEYYYYYEFDFYAYDYAGDQDSVTFIP